MTDNPDGTQTNGNGVVKFVGIILAVIGGLYGVNRDLSQRIEFLNSHHTQEIRTIQNQIDIIGTKMSADDGRERDVVGKLSQQFEKFKEVETQFNALREVVSAFDVRSQARFSKLEDWQSWWYRTVWGSHSCNKDNGDSQ